MMGFPRSLPFLLLFASVSAAQEYGFRGMEIYKLDEKTHQLTPCDIDRDGLTDLVVANNDKAKIEVLLRRREKVPPKEMKGAKLPNDLQDDQYFEKKEILTEKQVMSLAVADLDGDGNLDVAYYGKPEELVVAFGDGKGGFPRSKRWPIDDGSDVDAGDLDGDGRADLVLLEATATAIFLQSADGTLREPVKLPHSEKGGDDVRIVDLDGDGRKDLALIDAGSPRSVRARFQRADGSLGPEVAFETTPWRAIDFIDIDASPGLETVVVQRNSGVLRVLRLAVDRERALLGTVETYAFEAGGGGKARSLALGDVDGDTRLDVVVTEPGSAQVAVYLQEKGGGLGGRRLFPSLSASDAVRVADLDGDGRGEVLVLSSAEKSLGASRFGAEGRLPFPALLEVAGVPKAFDAADLDGDGKCDVVVVAEGPDDKKLRAQVWLQREATEGAAAHPFGALVLTQVIQLESLKQAPEDLLIMDIDQDGKKDL
ncbi:MAG: VCBS repeat-containing protein, partial [Planctomycetes bacterium]|nr:VCBS repeat-containing protein [Planctomycetota bacterium]